MRTDIHTALTWLRDAALAEAEANRAKKGNGALDWTWERAATEIQQHEVKLGNAVLEDNRERCAEHAADLANALAFAMHSIGSAPRADDVTDTVRYFFAKVSEAVEERLPVVATLLDSRNEQRWHLIALYDCRAVRERLPDEDAPIHVLAIIAAIGLARYADAAGLVPVGGGWHEPSGSIYGDY